MNEQNREAEYSEVAERNFTKLTELHRRSMSTEPRTFWFVVCWTDSGASYRAGPYDNRDEAEQAARMSMTREGQTITLMQTVPIT
jgi:hypothetical protein